MRTVTRYSILGLTLIGASVLLAGCPDLPVPPFDAAGAYSGAWETGEAKGACPFTLSLVHKPNFIYPLNHQILGVVEFSYGCLLDNALLEQIQDELPELKVPLFGNMEDDGSGRIRLGIDTAALAFPFSIDIDFDGTGADTDDDGVMDVYAGDYAITFSITTTIPGRERVDYTSAGTFSVTRDASPE
ncbi:MAG TPA: hypothetical protein PKL84_12095 [Candidatus Hydrogenedentes bacterium]|nr:hypothetical protein [Candidatus Hydrogenedentota bacterium]